MNTKKIMAVYDSLAAKKILLKQKSKKLSKEIKKIDKAIKNNHDTIDILNASVEIIHQSFKKNIEDTITKTIKKVFGRDLTFELQQKEKYNTIESKVVVKENGKEMDPLDDLGGSMINIIAFCFQIILWKMSYPRSRNVFILDEAFNWTGKLIEVVGVILKQITKKYKIQLIVITHEDELMNVADRVFLITHDGIESSVETFLKVA